jgi:aspartyl-tRNA(Asn)/glutamyl-tRNA(Gln) amidotransferase subunit A
MDIHRLEAHQIARLVQAKQLSAVEVATAICDRLERLNPSLNAFIDYEREAVLARATAVDNRIANGEQLPLAGVPFSVKDNLWLGGRPATFGSRLFADFVAPRDSWCVARMAELGGVALGVTNCSEFACKGVTTNPLHGATRNPWDLALTPGGSSGGAVAAVAAGLGPLALATDAGGSTRRPAAHTGLVGFKPSLGAVPNPWGFADPNHLLSVIGQLGRSVEDVALMARSLYAWHGDDPLSQPHFGAASLAPPEREPRTLRVAWCADLGLALPIDQDVLAAMEAALQALRRDGWFVEVASPRWPASLEGYALLGLQHTALAAQFGALPAAQLQQLDADIRAQVEAGRAISGVETAQLLQLRNELSAALANFFGEYDLLLCPTAPVEAWPVDQLGPVQIGGQPAGPRGHAGYTPIFNYCAVPALSLPCGVGRNGLPVGIQVVAARYQDALVLQSAAAIEHTLGLRLESPMLLE